MNACTCPYKELCNFFSHTSVSEKDPRLIYSTHTHNTVVCGTAQPKPRTIRERRGRWTLTRSARCSVLRRRNSMQTSDPRLRLAMLSSKACKVARQGVRLAMLSSKACKVAR